MNLVGSENEFIICERHANKKAKPKHRASPRHVERLTMIIGHDIWSYSALDI